MATAEERGVQVFVGAAGLAAHLPGVLASMTARPVIGVPLDGGALGGADALYAIVQMPPGVPVAAVAIGSPGAKNAGHLAARVLALGDAELAKRVQGFRKEQAAGARSGSNPEPRCPLRCVSDGERAAKKPNATIEIASSWATVRSPRLPSHDRRARAGCDDKDADHTHHVMLAASAGRR